MTDDRTESEIPKISQLLQARAAKLGLKITVRDEDEPLETGLDFGPFMLCSAIDDKDYHIWPHGLPGAGIADALNCYERELAVEDDEEIPDCWKTFGKE